MTHFLNFDSYSTTHENATDYFEYEFEHYLIFDSIARNTVADFY